MAIVVSDTSPIRALAFLGLMSLLRDLYSEILIPPAVDRELRNPPPGSIMIEVGDYPFVEIRAPVDQAQVERFLLSLDSGESEAICLALEIQAELVLLDESEGRAIARKNGLIPIGVLGTLLRAKERGLIIEVGPFIEKLQLELRFFVAPNLKADVLRLAGEL